MTTRQIRTASLDSTMSLDELFQELEEPEGEEQEEVFQCACQRPRSAFEEMAYCRPADADVDHLRSTYNRSIGHSLHEDYWPSVVTEHRSTTLSQGVHPTAAPKIPGLTQRLLRAR